MLKKCCCYQRTQGLQEVLKMKRVIAILLLSGLILISIASIGLTVEWTKKADMPTPRCMLATSVVNGKIYAIGGKNVDMNLVYATVEEYDTGFTPQSQSVNIIGKLINTWGKIKTTY